MRAYDEAEFDQFARSVWPRLYRTAAVIVSDRQLAEDLVQTALVKTYLGWPKLRDRDKALAFTRKVMVNTSRDWFRKHSWTREGVAADAGDTASVAGDHTPDRTDNVIDRLTLADHVRRLPPGQRAVVALRFLEDLSVAETADLLNVTDGTVKSQTSAALATLRTHLDALEGAHHD